jgi:hypothetical protein
LERQLAMKQVKVALDRMGKAKFDGWNDRGYEWHDECAYRALLAEGSSALRMAMARQGSTEQRTAQGGAR